MSTELADRLSRIESRMEQVEAQIDRLKRQQLHALGVTRAVRAAIKAWPGQFTARDILDLVKRGGIEISFSALSQRLMHMEKRGLIELVKRGAGPTLNVYQHDGTNLGPGGGTPRGTHHANTSGLICAIRGALDDLPEEFSLTDVERWLAQHWQGGKVPTRLNPYLVAFRKSGEIVVTRPRKTGPEGHCQLYRRAQRVAVNGDTLSPAEVAWREFRKHIKVESPADIAFAGGMREER